jgi:hypothetical protein
MGTTRTATDPPSPRKSFWAVAGVLACGGLGGLLPTLTKLAPIYIEVQAPPLPAPGFYLGLAIFFLVGAIVAGAYRERDCAKALLLGVAAPGLITNYLAGQSTIPALPATTTSAPAKDANQVIGALLGAAPAYAQRSSSTAAQASAPDASVITVVPRLVNGRTPYSIKPVQLQFVDKDGSVLQTTFLSPRVATTLSVPQGSKAIRALADDRQTSANLPAGDFSMADLDLAMYVSKGNDLVWALGGTRAARVDALTASVTNVRATDAAKAAQTPGTIDKGTSVVTASGQQVGVVDRVDNEPGEPARIVVKRQ